MQVLFKLFLRICTKIIMGPCRACTPLYIVNPRLVKTGSSLSRISLNYHLDVSLMLGIWMPDKNSLPKDLQPFFPSVSFCRSIWELLCSAYLVTSGADCWRSRCRTKFLFQQKFPHFARTFYDISNILFKSGPKRL